MIRNATILSVVLIWGIGLPNPGRALGQECSSDAYGDPQPRSGEIDVQRFWPSPHPGDILNVATSRLAGQFGWSTALWFNYASKLLQMVDNQRNPTISQGIVAHRGTMDLTGAVAFARWWFDLAVAVPIHVFNLHDEKKAGQPCFPTGNVRKAGFGDIRFQPRIRFLDADHSPVGLALDLNLILPTGTKTSFLSGGSLSFAPTLVLDGQIGPVRLAFNAAYRVRKQEKYLWVVANDEFLLALGAEARFAIGRYALHPMGTINLSLPTEDSQKELRQQVKNADGTTATRVTKEFATERIVMEGDLALRLDTPIGMFVTAGLGGGFLQGFGSPQIRALVGLGYEWTGSRSSKPDADGDGVADDDDVCHGQAEDMDGFRDGDGCPDPDNDGDNVLDRADRCADEPEDKDGYKDDDGCPDPDNDGDQVPDVYDQCPSQPEDVDGFADDDGCPDPDNDGDQIPDRIDQCPLQPETVNGCRDQDGCPEAPADPSCQAALQPTPTYPPVQPVQPMPTYPPVQPVQPYPPVAPVQPTPIYQPVQPVAPVQPFVPIRPVSPVPVPPVQPPTPVAPIAPVESGLPVLPIEGAVRFEGDHPAIHPDSFPLLDSVAMYLKQHPEFSKVGIHVHAYGKHNRKKNQDLSQERAREIMMFITAQGVASDRLVPKGFGDTKPMVDPKTPNALQVNERVEFPILQQR